MVRFRYIERDKEKAEDKRSYKDALDERRNLKMENEITKKTSDVTGKIIDKAEKNEVPVKEDKTYTNRKNLYELISDDINAADIGEAEKNRMLSRVIQLRNKKVNLLVAGATGAGKSSTINAMFNMEVAKVGVGVDPETDRLTSYELDNLTIWDTPGLGDGRSDKKYNKKIVRKLSELDDNGDPLIDLVLVIIDASSKDLGTSYNLINNVIIPCLGKEASTRILVGLNQADVAMKGQHWDAEKNEPDEILLDYLKRKAVSVRDRVKDATGIEIHPVFYCAGYKESEGEQREPYNLTKLLYYIVNAIPAEKRLAIADNINIDEDMWAHGDDNEEFKAKTGSKFLETIGDCISLCSYEAGVQGSFLLGYPGAVIGVMVGGIWGAISGFFKAVIEK